MVLESPHKDEYDENGIAKGSSYGTTGYKINEYFAEILTDFLNRNKFFQNLADGDYYIIIINAIAYQCSLRVDTKLYRDAMFLYMWEKERYRELFKKVVSDLVANRDNWLVINCYTLGEHLDLLTTHQRNITKEYLKEIGYNHIKTSPLSLKAIVSYELETVKTPQVYCTHPASWKNNNLPKIKEHL